MDLLDLRSQSGNTKAIGWFSAGVTSTVAIKFALEIYEEVEIYYFDTGQVHEDNARFLAQCEAWYGQTIHIRKSRKYDSPLDVVRKRRFVNGPQGALCTFEMKKSLRYDIQNEKGKDVKNWDQIFGFEFSKREVNRALRFREQYPDANAAFPLIDRQLTKPNCMALLDSVRINLPAMYELGYSNNNCLGCVKGGMGYWNKVRVDFPDIFEAMSQAEREIGRSCLRRNKEQLFLDELPEDAGRKVKEILPQCGVVCQVEFADFIDKRVERMFSRRTLIDHAELVKLIAAPLEEK